MKYNIVVCGGTFDHFHKGHKEFLKYALSLGERLLVGITSDKYLKKSKINPSAAPRTVWCRVSLRAGNQKSKIIEPFETRKKNLERFFIKRNTSERAEIEPIDDIYIPKTWEDLPIESIIVSKNTIEGAKQINLKRIEQKKYPLKIEVVPLVKSANNEYISSSNIRDGIIDRNGKPYLNPLWLKHDLAITAGLRKKLRKPFGSLLQNDVILVSAALHQTVRGAAHPESPTIHRDSGKIGMTQSPYLITVGDVTTKTFNNLSLNQDISVVDFKVARKKEFSSLIELGFSGREKIIKVVNPPGYLTASLFKAVSKLFKRDDKKQKIVFVEGEEDLSVLPFILVAPLRSFIFYGQPNEGVVKVVVSEETKKKAYKIVSQFSVCTRGH